MSCPHLRPGGCRPVRPRAGGWRRPGGEPSPARSGTVLRRPSVGAACDSRLAVRMLAGKSVDIDPAIRVRREKPHACASRLDLEATVLDEVGLRDHQLAEEPQTLAR